MEKILGEFSTVIKVSGDEAKDICKLGRGTDCCAFLIISSDGFECMRMSYPTNSSIFIRLEEGTMNAHGTGGWSGCGWEGEI